MSQKYIEELSGGDCFFIKDDYFVVTSDFRTNKKLCINLKDGNIRWLKFDMAVEIISIYTIDDSSNFMPIKQEPINDAIKNQNIS